MDHSPLGKLSAELRNTISAMVLQHESILITICKPRSGSDLVVCQSNDQGNRHPLALAQTCRQNRDEYFSMYHANNKFALGNINVSYPQFRAWFQKFTDAGKLKLGGCVTIGVLRDTNDEAMLASLRTRILRIPKFKQDGLTQVEFVMLHCNFMGNKELLTFSCDMLPESIYGCVINFHRKMLTGIHPAGIPPTHGSKCLIRSTRIILCLEDCLLELLTKGEVEFRQEGLREDEMSLEDLREDMEDVRDSLKEYIEVQALLEDTPCTDQGCCQRMERLAEAQARANSRKLSEPAGGERASV